MKYVYAAEIMFLKVCKWLFRIMRKEISEDAIYPELKEQLVKKTLQPLYISTGEEIAIMNIHIDKIAEIMNVKPKRVDSIGSIFWKLRNQSFINKPSCYVISGW